jgi:hypothetical protein
MAGGEHQEVGSAILASKSDFQESGNAFLTSEIDYRKLGNAILSTKKDFGKPKQPILPSKHQQKIIHTMGIIPFDAIILGREYFNYFSFQLTISTFTPTLLTCGNTC